MEEILKILEEIRPEFDFKASSNFIEDGLLDSFDIVTLVNILEEKYQIKIDGLDIIPENFSSAESIFNIFNKNKN
ncbi:MAG: acyl carrier protein [Synergistaceae bacterium]|nr:acyl carrier protein [Synergistaceae bacterium]